MAVLRRRLGGSGWSVAVGGCMTGILARSETARDGRPTAEARRKRTVPRSHHSVGPVHVFQKAVLRKLRFSYPASSRMSAAHSPLWPCGQSQ